MTGESGAIMQYFVGLDLGPLAQFSALAVIERPFVPSYADAYQRRPAHALRHLQRFPPGTSIPEILTAVRTLYRQPALAHSVLVVDQTGVGKAVTDWAADQLLGQIIATYVPVNITSGHDLARAETGAFLIPKKELAGTLQVLLQAHRLHVARSLPDAAMLVKELENFKVKVVTLQENTIENWREGDHDDLVLAVALAAYVSEVNLPSLTDEGYP